VQESYEKYSRENIWFSQVYASTYSIDLIIIYESTLMLIIIHQRENLKI
jgi:hypothetical protein